MATFNDFLEAIGIHFGGGFWGFVIVAATVFLDFTPKTKFNLWSKLIEWAGNSFNKKIDKTIDVKIDGLDKKVSEIEKKVNKLSEDLSSHITESEMKSLQDTRRDILEFCRSCIKKERHTEEQFRFVLKQCDNYETYIETTGTKNGEITAAIKEIRRVHEKCMQENDFLKEGE